MLVWYEALRHLQLAPMGGLFYVVLAFEGLEIGSDLILNLLATDVGVVARIKDQFAKRIQMVSELNDSFFDSRLKLQ